ncbi:MAG TPA: hypothetical protein VI653_03160 [Steroidobacteraceae bacterium]
MRDTALDRLKGYQAGAIDYLLLPIAPEILRSKIAILVDLYQQRREFEELVRALVSARPYSHPRRSGQPPFCAISVPTQHGSLRDDNGGPHDCGRIAMFAH